MSLSPLSRPPPEWASHNIVRFDLDLNLFCRSCRLRGTERQRELKDIRICRATAAMCVLPPSANPHSVHHGVAVPALQHSIVIVPNIWDYSWDNKWCRLSHGKRVKERVSEKWVGGGDNLSCSSLDEFNTSLARLWWCGMSYMPTSIHIDSRRLSSVCVWVCKRIWFFFFFRFLAALFHPEEAQKLPSRNWTDKQNSSNNNRIFVRIFFFFLQEFIFCVCSAKSCGMKGKYSFGKIIILALILQYLFFAPRNR